MATRRAPSRSAFAGAGAQHIKVFAERRKAHVHDAVEAARARAGEVGAVAIVGERDDAGEFEFEIGLADGAGVALRAWRDDAPLRRARRRRKRAVTRHELFAENSDVGAARFGAGRVGLRRRLLLLAVLRSSRRRGEREDGKRGGGRAECIHVFPSLVRAKAGRRLVVT